MAQVLTSRPRPTESLQVRTPGRSPAAGDPTSDRRSRTPAGEPAARRPREADAWTAHAEELAQWALDHLVVRQDGHGGYYVDRRTGKARPVTRHQPADLDVLVNHFLGARQLVRDERGIAQDREGLFPSDPCPRE
jgi:hypothetical protein